MNIKRFCSTLQVSEKTNAYGKETVGVGCLVLRTFSLTLSFFLLADFRLSFNPKIVMGIASASSSYDPLRLALAWKPGHPHRRPAKLGTLERSVITASNIPRIRKWHKRRGWLGRGRGVLWNPPSQQTAAQLCGAWSRHDGVRDSTFCHETVSANTKGIHTVILPKR